MWTRLLLEMVAGGYAVGLIYVLLAVPKTPVALGTMLALVGALFPRSLLLDGVKPDDEEGRVLVRGFGGLSVKLAGATRPILCGGGIAIVLVALFSTYIEQEEIMRSSGEAAKELAHKIQSLDATKRDVGISDENLTELLRELEQDALDKAYRHWDDPAVAYLLTDIESRLRHIGESPFREASNLPTLSPRNGMPSAMKLRQ